MTGELGVAVLLVPDTHGPIVRAGDENGTVVGVPVWVASNAVDWTHMTVIVVGVSFRERS